MTQGQAILDILTRLRVFSYKTYLNWPQTKYYNHNPPQIPLFRTPIFPRRCQSWKSQSKEWQFTIFYKWEKNIKEERKLLPPKLIKSMLSSVLTDKNQSPQFPGFETSIFKVTAVKKSFQAFLCRDLMNSSPSPGISFSFIAFWSEHTDVVVLEEFYAWDPGAVPLRNFLANQWLKYSEALVDARGLHVGKPPLGLFMAWARKWSIEASLNRWSKKFFWQPVSHHLGEAEDQGWTLSCWDVNIGVGGGVGAPQSLLPPLPYPASHTIPGRRCPVLWNFLKTARWCRKSGPEVEGHWLGGLWGLNFQGD